MSMLSEMAGTLNAVSQPIEEAIAGAHATASGCADLRDLMTQVMGSAPRTTMLHTNIENIAERLSVVLGDLEDMSGLVEAWTHGADYPPGAGTSDGPAGGSVEANLKVVIAELTAIKATVDIRGSVLDLESDSKVYRQEHGDYDRRC